MSDPPQRYQSLTHTGKFWMADFAWKRLIMLAVDASGDIGRLLCPVSVRPLGGAGFHPTPLATGWAVQETFSRTFRSAIGLCRAPVADQRADHQFSAGAVTHPAPPLSDRDGLRDSAPSHPVYAGSKRYV